MSDATPIQRGIVVPFQPLSDAGGQVGAAITDTADKVQQFEAAHEAATQQHDLVKGRLQLAQGLDGLDDQFRTDSDPDTMVTRYQAAADKLSQSIGASLQGNAATQFADDAGMMAESKLRNIKDIAFGRQVSQANASLDDLGETLSRQAAYGNPAEATVAIANYDKSVNGMVSTGMLSAEAGERKVQGFKEKYSLYAGKRAVLLNPATALKKLGDPNYLPDMDELHRVELQGEAMAQIRVREREARQDQMMNRLAADQAANDLHENIVAGVPVAQSVIEQAVNTAHATGDIRAVAKVTGLLGALSQVDGLRKASPREVDAKIEALTQQAYQGGADAATATQLIATHKFKETMNVALAKDPLLWGQSQGVIPLAPLKLDGTDTPAQIAARKASARIIAQHYSVPYNPFTQSEVEALKTRLDSHQDPNVKLATLQGVVHGFGADAPLVLSKLGAADPALANAGALIASGAAHQAAARDVLIGTSLLADKANAGLRPSYNAKGYAGMPALLSAYGFLPPDVGTSVQSSADAIYAARATRMGLGGGNIANSSGSLALYQRAFQEASGAHFEANGIQWGGIGHYRSNRVLVPDNIKVDDFEDLVSRFQPSDLAKASVNGAKPLWEGGDAPAGLLGKTWLVSGGNGVYGLSVTDPSKGAQTPLKDNLGQPFRFRFNTALVAMQARTKGGQ